MRTPSMRSGAPLPVMLKLAPIAAATRSNAVFSVLISRYCPSDSQSRGTLSPGDRCHSIRQTLGLRVRQGPEQERVRDAEDRAGGPDADRERQKCRDREPRGFDESAEAVHA